MPLTGGDGGTHLGRCVSFLKSPQLRGTFVTDENPTERRRVSAVGFRAGTLQDGDRVRVDSSSLLGFVRPPMTPPSTCLLGRRGDGSSRCLWVSVGAGAVSGGTQPRPCMGRLGAGVAEGSPAVWGCVLGPLSVGTLERPDPGHLVEDFQGTDKDKENSVQVVGLRRGQYNRILL